MAGVTFGILRSSPGESSLACSRSLLKASCGNLPRNEDWVLTVVMVFFVVPEERVDGILAGGHDDQKS